MEWLYSIVTAIINRMFKDFFKKVLHGVSTWGVRDWIAFIILIAVIANPLFMNFKIPDSIIKREWSEKAKAERYTEKVTPIINEQIQYILMSDKDATNVMLLSYHNSNHSSQGFSYKYITFYIILEKVFLIAQYYLPYNISVYGVLQIPLHILHSLIL